MPRMLRLEAPGSLVHVIARGLEGASIFRCIEDRIVFLSRLGFLLQNVGFKCLTWCLMDNHYHLLLRTNEKPLSQLLRPLNGGYARWFNKKYVRNGYLFQDRFKSILCQDQEYAIQLIRYINLNPLRAGLVKSLEDLESWPWCGHSYLLDKLPQKQFLVLDRLEALGRFGRNEKCAIQNYIRFLAQGIKDGGINNAGLLPKSYMVEIEGSHKGWPSVIGDPEFARRALENHRIGLRRKHRQADYFAVMKNLRTEICTISKIAPEEFHFRGHLNSRSDARALFAFRAHYKELIPWGVVSDFLGITIPPVVRLAARGKLLQPPKG